MGPSAGIRGNRPSGRKAGWEIGSVENGRLRIGEMTYHTVILPGLLTIRPTTLALLHKW